MDKIKLLGVPFDFGQEHVGVRLAATYLKDNGLITKLNRLCPVEDMGEFRFPFKVVENGNYLIKQKRSCSKMNAIINDSIASMDLNASFLLNIGGDHGMGLGTIHGMLHHNPQTVVIWADAHGDINTPELSPSGNFHGMPLAFLLGLAKDPEFSWITRKLLPENLIFFGPRDLDAGEREIINQLKIQYFSSNEINLLGASEILEMALHRADPHSMKPIHLSMDVDLFDADVIKATGTKVPHGPRLEEVVLMGGLLAETGRLRSMDLVEFNPLVGTEQEVEASAELIQLFLENTLKQVFINKPKLHSALFSSPNLNRTAWA